MTVSAQPECAWTAASEANWITNLSPVTGQGGGAIEFRAAANPLPSPRQGTIQVNGDRVVVSQEAAACQFDISPRTLGVDAAAGTGSVAVSATSGCAWTASSEVPWIVLSSGSGAGNGTVEFSFTANTGAERSGTIVIAGQAFTLTQSAVGTVAPPAGPCQYQISPASHAIDARGGSGPVEVLTNSGCQWTAVSNAVWIVITSGANGSGRGVVGVQVAPNSGATRTGTAQIAGRTLTITQAAAPPPSCTYSVSPTSQSVPKTSGSATPIAVQTTNNCSWSASSQATWITVVEGATGSGNGSVRIAVTENSGAERTGSLTVAGQTVTLTQAAAPPPPVQPPPVQPPTPAPCSYAVSPTSVSLGSSPGTGAVSVVTNATCDWTAQSQAAWLSITSASSGRGNASISFSAAENSGSARTGTLTIAGQTVTVTQAAAPAPSPSPSPACTYTISPAAVSVGADAGTTSFGVTSASGCAWTATPNANWLSVSGAASGTGSGNVSIAVAANTGSARTGSVSVAGQTFTVNQAAAPPPPPPPPPSCTFSVTPETASFTQAGGTSEPFIVSTGSECSWTATTGAAWITIASGATGTGSGTVRFDVAANSGAQRTGTVTIAGRSVTVTQAAAPPPPPPPPCDFSVSPQAASVAAAGGPGDPIAVTTGADCTWSATSSAAWITITSGATGKGSGTVTFSVAANSGAQRTGTITIEGRTVTVTQEAPAPVPCSYSISPSSESVPAAGGTGTPVTVNTGTDCAWTAASNATWITITSSASGTGPSSVTFSVAANSGSARSGTLTIAGQTFTVNQAAPCVYSIDPQRRTLQNSRAADLSVNVTAPSGCTWTAQSNASWITVQSGATGNGNGVVQLRVARNEGGADRTGTVTIAGQTFTITQEGDD